MLAGAEGPGQREARAEWIRAECLAGAEGPGQREARAEWIPLELVSRQILTRSCRARTVQESGQTAVWSALCTAVTQERCFVIRVRALQGFSIAVAATLV